MVGVFVAFIRVVYGRMIYMSLPEKFGFIQHMLTRHSSKPNKLRYVLTQK